MLVHVLDISGSEGRDPFEDYCQIRSELMRYSDKLAELPELIVANKMDIIIISIKYLFFLLSKKFSINKIVSTNKMNVTRRTCGYLGTNYWNQGRTQEIKERVLHL